MPKTEVLVDMDLIATDEQSGKVRKLYFCRVKGVDTGYAEMVELFGKTSGYKAHNYGLVSTEAALARFNSPA